MRARRAPSAPVTFSPPFPQVRPEQVERLLAPRECGVDVTLVRPEQVERLLAAREGIDARDRQEIVATCRSMYQVGTFIGRRRSNERRANRL
eukprot:1175455-Prorocentrum_minimum.AAC.1